MNSVFVSYRRTDSTPYAVSLATALRQALGSMNVFLDQGGMVIGEPFPARLEGELAAARACIIVIGPDWLRAADKDGRRRIDDPDDWVHREVRLALQRGIAAPVLVKGASMPAPSALPEPLRELSLSSGSTLNDDTLVQDLRRFVADLCRRTALLRSYRFRSFEDAIHFMATASRFITRTEHHPAWSNIWRTVTVRLTTFDIQHRPSVFDLRLAEYLDDLYREYRAPTPEPPGRPSGPRDPMVPR